MRLVVVRHSIRTTTSEVNCSISEDGVTLAKKIGDDLEYMYIDANLCKTIISSPYTRALETSMCIQKAFLNAEIKIDPLVRETLFNTSQWDNIGKPLQMFINLETCDTWESITERCEEFLSKITSEYESDDDIIVVTHGGIVNVILSLVDPTYTFERVSYDPRTYVPQYCGYIVIDYNDNKWTLIHKVFD